jgi:uncharacterized damage-inducible protein DinB
MALHEGLRGNVCEKSSEGLKGCQPYLNRKTLDVSQMDPKSLFDYSQELRDGYLEQLAKLPWEEVVKSRGASFDSLRNILLHTVDAEDRLINYIIPGRTKDWVSLSMDDFRDMDSIRKRVREVEAKSKNYVTKLDSVELERKVEMPRMGGSISVRVEDVIVHSALENIHHFGELIALLWQMDLDPAHMGWLAYLQK